MSMPKLTLPSEEVRLLSPAEEEAQQVLILLSEASQEAQLIVINRLLTGVTAKLTATVANKAVEIAKTPPQEPRPSNPRSSRSKTTQIKHSYESQLGKLDDPLDPFEAWEKLGGADGLATILPQEQIGVLQGMLQHPNMPPGRAPKGNTNRAVSAAILERLKVRLSDR